MPERVRLQPGRPTRIPGTNCELWWAGDREVVIYQGPAGIWDLSPLTRWPGRVMAWQRLADRTHLGWWPIVPLASSVTARQDRTRPRTR